MPDPATTSGSASTTNASGDGPIERVKPEGALVDLMQGDADGSSSYLVTNSEFATVSARTNARDRVMEGISSDIKLQVATFLRTRAAQRRAPQ